MRTFLLLLSMLSFVANAGNNLELKPIYGWGWFAHEGAAVEVPDQLVIELSHEATGEGVIVLPQQYAGQRVQIHKRSEYGNVIHYNVKIYKTAQEINVTGYAQSM
jgi:hypothetical protein